MEIGSMTALKTYVENGFGFALVPESVLDPLPRGTKALPVSGTSIDMLTGFIYKSVPTRYASGKLFQFLKTKLSRFDS